MLEHVQGARITTLLDGGITWTDSPEWLHECLARALLFDYSPQSSERILDYIQGESPEREIALRETMALIFEQHAPAPRYRCTCQGPDQCEGCYYAQRDAEQGIEDSSVPHAPAPSSAVRTRDCA